MKTLLVVAVGAALFSGAAGAQTFPTASAAPLSSGNAGDLLGNSSANPTAQRTVPPTATDAAGKGVTKAGQAIDVASGAHGAGPAPIVSGTVPQAKPFPDSVTDSLEKVGHGVSNTGKNVSRSGVTVSPTGAQTALQREPASAQRQAASAATLAAPPR